MNTEQLIPVLEFNFAPASYIDNSWIAELPNSHIVEFLQASSEGKKWASRYILESYGLLEKHDLDFSQPVKTLALASSKQLTPIVFHAGLALNGPLLKGIVRRQERQAVEACIGRDGYDYAVKKGPFIAGTLPHSFDSRFVIDWNNPQEIKKHIFRSGVRLLGVVFGQETDAFQKRLLFKFPMVSKDYFYAGTAANHSTDVVRQSGIMLRKLMKEFMR